MFGSLLSKAIKVVTLPVDAAEIVVDVATGGDGDRRDLRNTFPLPSDVRDAVAKAAEDIDD